MRAVFSRIGSKISCDGNTRSVLLICAALIGRRVFILAAAFLCAITVVRRLIQLDVSEPEPRDPDNPPVAFIVARAPNAFFQPPREFEIAELRDVSALRETLERAVVGQRDASEALMLALLAGGHFLLEGAPGLAKTLACRTLAGAVDGSFSRVQCTADQSPADII